MIQQRAVYLGIPVPELGGLEAHIVCLVESLQLRPAGQESPHPLDDLHSFDDGKGRPLLQQVRAEELALEAVSVASEVGPHQAQALEVAAPNHESVHHFADAVYPLAKRRPDRIIAHHGRPLKVCERAETHVDDLFLLIHRVVPSCIFQGVKRPGLSSYPYGPHSRSHQSVAKQLWGCPGVAKAY